MSDRQDIEPHAHQGTTVKRDSLARTAPLFALLFVMLLVYGLAVLTGATTNHGVLILALVLLVAATYGVVAGTVKMIELPPEDGDGEPEHGSVHGH
jgi:uncharacterized membrane protein